MRKLWPIAVGIVVVLGGSFFIAASAGAVGAYPYAVGGTGTTTPNPGQVTYWGSSNLKGIATTSVTCGTGTSCTAFTVIGASPITITASGAAAAFIWTDNYNATNAATSSIIWAQSGLNASSTSHFVYASTTALTIAGLASTTNLNISAIPSALIVTNSNGVTAAYGGSSCTNQFIRSLSALGAATCATVSAGDVSLANLTATDATLTFSGTYNGSTARTIGINLANPNTWTALQTINYASTTAISITGAAYIPSAANPTIGTSATAGTNALAIDTTQASTSLHYYDGTAERAIFNETSSVFVYATSSPSGTTTVIIAGPIRKATMTQLGCNSVGGTAYVVFGSGTASSTGVTSSVGNVTSYTTESSNNTFNQGVSAYLSVGAFSAATVTSVSCSFGWRYDPN